MISHLLLMFLRVFLSFSHMHLCIIVLGSLKKLKGKIAIISIITLLSSPSTLAPQYPVCTSVSCLHYVKSKSLT